MLTTAVRIHGAHDLRVDTFDLPELGPGEILGELFSDSICMSSFKLAEQGEGHKRVRGSLAETPIIVGHEFSGVIRAVGSEWADRFAPGQRFIVQTSLNYQGTLWAPGYSYPWIGGGSRYVIIPREVMEIDCLLTHDVSSHFMSSLVEPMSCIVGGFNSMYHTTNGSYEHRMGIVEGGTLALLASVGPMGLGSIDYAVNADRKPRRIVVTDIDQTRLDRAASLITVADAAAQGIELIYLNTGGLDDPAARLIELNEGQKFDDVFVFAPVRPVVELGNAIMGQDGCMNFFAGPARTDFAATVNFYDVHYAAHHFVANTGGNTDDMVQSLELMAAGRLRPEFMVTHVGGLDAYPDTVANLPSIPGGKKLMYVQKKLPLFAIDDLGRLGANDPFYAELGRICAHNNGLWSEEAENYLLAYAPDIA